MVSYLDVVAHTKAKLVFLKICLSRQAAHSRLTLTKNIPCILLIARILRKRLLLHRICCFMKQNSARSVDTESMGSCKRHFLRSVRCAQARRCSLGVEFVGVFVAGAEEVKGAERSGALYCGKPPPELGVVALTEEVPVPRLAQAGNLKFQFWFLDVLLYEATVILAPVERFILSVSSCIPL